MTPAERSEAAARMAHKWMVEAGADPVEAADTITRELSELAHRSCDFQAMLARVRAGERAPWAAP